MGKLLGPLVGSHKIIPHKQQRKQIQKEKKRKEGREGGREGRN